MSMKNQVAIVTASTRGIGLAIANTLASKGTKVYFAVRRPDAGAALAEELKKKGMQADAVYFDASVEASAKEMVDTVWAKEKRLDILVNNYGGTDVNTDLDLLTGDTDAFFQINQDNLQSVYLPSKAAIPLMIQTGGGSIVNISSVGGRYPDLSRLAYGVSKAAINFLTQNIAVQYARQGVRCNAVLPGLIATDAALKNMPSAFLETFLRNVPLGRMGTPEDIAHLVAFLCSPEASFVTGELIAVAGGFGLPSPMYGMTAQKSQ